MKEVLVQCGPAKSSSRAHNFDEIIILKPGGPDQNLRVQIDSFESRVLDPLPDAVVDLINIAAFVYSADTRVSRGTDTDVYNKNWVRRFTFEIPVLDLNFWSRSEVQSALTETLEFLAGDYFNFSFVSRKDRVVQESLFSFKQVNEASCPDVAVCFSGGLDSLTATYLALDETRKPLLISHRSAPKIDSRQKTLVELLRSANSSWQFPHLSMWVHRVGGKRAAETTQRTRAFLYMALATAAACGLDLSEIWLCDNGIVSINLPQSGQNWGSLLSRSTHPRFIEYVQQLGRLVSSNPSLKVRNRLLFFTKKEVVEGLANWGDKRLIQEAVSCAHVEGSTKFQPHCGVCTQCIDRRFATLGAGLAENDLAERYKIDIFKDRIAEGKDRIHLENYIRFAYQLSRLPNSDSFFEKYPEAYDSLGLNDQNVELHADLIWQLFMRHQRGVNQVLDEFIKSESTSILEGTAQDGGLLHLITAGFHKVDLKRAYVEKLCELVCKGVPPTFQSQPARNEKHVQDVCEGLFLTARKELEREAPQLPFSSVSTKPDFSKTNGEGPALFVEFKFLKARNRLNSAITEITSRIHIYRRQGAWALFLVYDPKRVIVDDEKFASDLNDDSVFVRSFR